MKDFFLWVLTILLALGLSAVYVLAQDEVKDPVCGMKLKLSEAKFKSIYKNNTYYFCSADCKAKFDKEPEKFALKETPLKIFCCRLDETLAKDVNIEKKETEKGIIVTMSSSKPEVVKKLQDTVGKCKNEMMHKEHTEHGGECCLMHMKDVKSVVTNIENGIKIEFTTENPKALESLKMKCKESSCCKKEHKH